MTHGSPLRSAPVQKEPEAQAARGSEELVALLDPAMVKALPDPRLWQQVPSAVATYLVHTCAQSPWLNHLALAGAVYAASRVADPGACLERVHRFFSWAIPEHFPDLAHLPVEKAMIAYFGNPPQRRGTNLFKSYNAVQIHLERFVASLAPDERVALAPFLLPSLPYSPILKKLTGRLEEKTRQTRKERTYAVVKHLPDLVALARRRYRWLSELDAQLQQVTVAVQHGEIQLPTILAYPSLEGSEKLHFRVWNRTSWSRAHAEDCLPKAHDPLFLQYVGPLPEHSWFLRAVACGALQGQSRSAEARRYGAEWGVGLLRCPDAGLFTPDREMSQTLQWVRRAAAGTAEDSRIIFSLEPLLAAAAVGLFVLVSAVSTGMRIGELQQLTLDRECMEMLALPQYDDTTGQWEEGPPRLYWRLYPKGHLKRERYLVTPHMSEAMFLLLDLHKRLHGERRLASIGCGQLPHFSHCRRFPGRHRFVLQWGGKHLSLQGLTKCVQFLLLEHVCRDDQGQPVPITVHLLRHGVASWLRQKGVPLEDIMVLLKQVNLAVTDYYGRLSPESLQQKLGPALTALAELAGTDPALVRTPEEICHLAQEALLRFGALRRTPGGYCGTFDPCLVHFACATCRFYVPDPRRRAEVATKLVLAERIAALRREAGDHLEADNEVIHRREWERILQEMEALDRVPLVSPSPETVLQNLADDNLMSLFLPLPTEPLTLLPGGKESDAPTIPHGEGPRAGGLPSTQSTQSSAHGGPDTPSDRAPEG
jgi:integrase